MVTEIKPKCYTCLDPIAIAYPFGSAGLASSAGFTCCQGSDLDHCSTLVHHELLTD